MYVDFPTLLTLGGLAVLLLRVDRVDARCKGTYTLNVCLRKELGELKQKTGVFMSDTKNTLIAVLERMGVITTAVESIGGTITEIKGDIQELKALAAGDPELDALVTSVSEKLTTLETKVSEVGQSARQAADEVPEPEPPVTEEPETEEPPVGGPPTEE